MRVLARPFEIGAVKPNRLAHLCPTKVVCCICVCVCVSVCHADATGSGVEPDEGLSARLSNTHHRQTFVYLYV